MSRARHDGSEPLRIPRRKPLSAGRRLRCGPPHLLGAVPRAPEEMHRKQGHLTARFQRMGVEVRDFGLVDQAQAAYELLNRLKVTEAGPRLL